MASTATVRPGKGRHRRPRRRKVLFAAGGLALAAGALSLVRLTPHAGVGTAEAEPPRAAPEGSEGSGDRSANAAATVGGATPSATSTMGGASALPTGAVSLAPTAVGGGASRAAVRAATPYPTTSTPVATTIPDRPNTPRPTRTASAAPTPSAAQPAPTTVGPQPTSPAPTAGQGLCVPLIGLCLNPSLTTTP